MKKPCTSCGAFFLVTNAALFYLCVPMRNSLITLSIILLSIFSAVESKAQHFYGLQSSNWAGVNHIYSNPAELVNGRYRTHVNVVNFGTNVNFDFASLDMPFSPLKLITGKVPDQYKNSNGQVQWSSDWIKTNYDGSAKNMYLGLEMRGPAAMFSFKKLAIAAGTRTRSSLQIYNLSEELVKFGLSQIDSTNNNYSSIKDNNFSLNLNAYQEFTFSAAAMVWNKQPFLLKVGATAKYLMGLGSVYVINNGIDFSQSGDSILINKSDIAVGHSNSDFINRIQNGTFTAALPTFNNLGGNGFGVDLGAVFEYSPEAADALTGKTNYLFKAGLSLLDWGKITYKNSVNTYSASNNTPKWFVADSNFDAAFEQGIDSGIRYIEQYAKDNLNYQKGTGTYTSTIPTTLNFRADYNIFKWFYVGLNWTQAVVNKRDIAFRRPSSVVVIPRFESKVFEFSLPLSVYQDYSVFGIGAYMRLGPVFLGTDNFITSLRRNSYNGVDFYFGISTGIPSKKKK